jgi:hypothetical protein
MAQSANAPRNPLLSFPVDLLRWRHLPLADRRALRLLFAFVKKLGLDALKLGAGHWDALAMAHEEPAVTVLRYAGEKPAVRDK